MDISTTAISVENNALIVWIEDKPYFVMEMSDSDKLELINQTLGQIPDESMKQLIRGPIQNAQITALRRLIGNFAKQAKTMPALRFLPAAGPQKDASAS